jgi:hypothetical protein
MVTWPTPSVCTARDTTLPLWGLRGDQDALIVLYGILRGLVTTSVTERNRQPPVGL